MIVRKKLIRQLFLMLLKNEEHMDKVLVTALKSTTNINNLINRTNFQALCHSMKYNVLHITSKYGVSSMVRKFQEKHFSI